MADGFNTIKEFIDYLSEKYTTRAAYKFIVDESVESRTYNQLKADSYSLASFLVNKGYNHNHIAILGGTSYDWIVSFFCCCDQRQRRDSNRQNAFRKGDAFPI